MITKNIVYKPYYYYFDNNPYFESIATNKHVEYFNNNNGLHFSLLFIIIFLVLNYIIL